MTEIPEITVVCATTKDHGKSIEAIHKTLQHIKPHRVILFSDIPFNDEAFECIVIPRFKSVEDYNYFIFKEMVDWINTSHILVIQHDGYVLDGNAWNPEFLKYDYIGAPWTYTDGRNVGNGGFSLRSTRLHRVLQLEKFEYTSPEDEKICRYYRQTLQNKYHIRFAPDELAHTFSYEMHKPMCPTFGFHNNFHTPYKEPVILKRSGAMGDIIMMEPVMEALHKKGYRIILDTPKPYYSLFYHHFYEVEHIEDVIYKEDASNYRVINLDMVYEVCPRQNAILSYAKACGVEIELRNPRLAYVESKPLFDKYIVLHTDDTDMPHRNAHGIDWSIVAKYFEDNGYLVLRVGIGNGTGGVKVNTYNEHMLAWLIAGAKMFIGIDSGPSQIAVATGVKSVILFGSVDYRLRYTNLDNILPIQNKCPIAQDGCYHSVISVRGKDCEVDVNHPPCITHDSEAFLTKIIGWLKKN